MRRRSKIRHVDGVQILAIASLFAVCLLILIPFLLMFMSSVTDENTLLVNGYTFFPAKFSLAAYDYIFRSSGMILASYGYSVLVTAIGTTGSLFLTVTMAYPLSRQDFRFRRFFSFFIFFTMLFNGGLISQYMLWSTILKIKNTVWAYIIPNLLMSGFYVMIVRNYFISSIPVEVVESAKIDGCGELYAFWKIVLPVLGPGLATVGLFQALGYWNDWYRSSMFSTSSETWSLQFYLYDMVNSTLAMRQMAQNVSLNTADLPTQTVKLAMAVVATGPVLLFYPFVQRYFVSGITIGAVKG